MRKITAAATIPADLAKALASNPKSDRVFRALSPSHQRQYIKWVTEPKKLETRQRRVAKAAKMAVEKAPV